MAASPPPAQRVETSTASISYRDVGEGPVVILGLHGGGPGATGWGNFSGNVADMAGSGKFRFIIPDQPGFGDSRLTKDSGVEYHWESAKAMAELLQKLNIPKANLIGNSMGGGVALRMAIDHPEVVDRIVLMGPYFHGFAEKNIMGPPPEGNSYFGSYYPEPTVDRMRAFVHRFIEQPDKIQGLEDIIKSRHALTLKPEIETGYKRMMTGKPNPDARPPAEQIATVNNPTLIMWGREDRFCTLEQGFQYLEALKNSELLVLRDTGHWAMIEARPQFASHVAAFFTRDR